MQHLLDGDVIFFTCQLTKKYGSKKKFRASRENNITSGGGKTMEVEPPPAARPWSYLPTYSTGQSEGFISSFFFPSAQSLPIVHHSTDQSESDMGVVCGAMPAV